MPDLTQIPPHLFVAGWLLGAGVSWILFGIIGSVIDPTDKTPVSLPRMLLFWPVTLALGVFLLIGTLVQRVFSRKGGR